MAEKAIKRTRSRAQAKSREAKRDGRRSGGDVELISFDFQRNLINILGEEHYPYAEFLYHELAANAWDSDATEVHITEKVVRSAARGAPALYDIIVVDDGNGMDFEGLGEYFRVGDSRKRHRKVSERLGRPLIGRIGVGKVSILKVARSWRITTERHLGLNEPVRLNVHVEVDDWIEGRLNAFPVQYVEPTGQPGTEIVLEGVQTRLREDRILRHLQRLPLAEELTVWRNGQFVPPRQWHGIDRIPIDAQAEWESEGVRHSGRIIGEIWIRQQPKNKREQAYLKEPATEKEGLERDPAGMEVRVNSDMITREFFGHESHGHAVNRLWGWVEAAWLPIVGNRTDYLRDSPEGHAFYDAVKPLFDEAYNKVRYERESRAQQRRQRQQQDQDSQAKADQARSVSEIPEPETSDELIASRYGEVINQVLSDKPEFAPVIEQRAVTARGRPAKDRIYPVRPASGEKAPFERDIYGTDLGLEMREQKARAKVAVPGSVRRSDVKETERLQIGEVTVNTKAGVKLRFVALGALEAPYRWSLDDPEELTLDINTDHKLYTEATAADRPGAPLHRLHCAWLVSLALAERAFPASGESFSDYLEAVSYELFSGWGPRRRRTS